jgi:Flp pilus assembly protein TadD
MNIKVLSVRQFKLFISIILLTSTAIALQITQYKRPALSPHFAPSNAKTATGELIPADQFFPAARCQKCHADSHASWSESLHRNAAREPFYRESADILLKTVGIESTRHCESCHTPVALFSGAISEKAARKSAPFTKLDDEGVTCSVCHSITEVRPDGTGSYTIRRPALLAQEDGTPVDETVTDEQILADIPGHKRAVMRPLMRTPEFCAVCHKVDAPPELNGYKHIRGFSAYDEWQQSGASHEAVLPFYRRPERVECRTCHMPRVESLNDRSAKEGKIASHRWFGANMIAPLFYGQTNQVKGTAEFLKAMVVEADIFAVRREGTGELVGPVSGPIKVTPGEALTVEVVISNRNAAHSFPPEVRDLYEAWVEFEVLTPLGKKIFHSGFIKPNGMLDESAHVYRQIILDDKGRQITRHQIWTTNIKAYDNTINAGRSDVVRYRFKAPDCRKQRALCGSGRVGALQLRARVNYRRLNQEYANYVLKQRKRRLANPVVRMAEVEGWLAFGTGTPPQSTGKIMTPEWKRWNDYGIGQLEQAQYGPATQAFRMAAGLSPTDPDLLVSAAISELKTERYDMRDRPQLRKAEDLVKQALKLQPESARARYQMAIIDRAQGRFKEAAERLEGLAKEYPRDREVQRQLAQTHYTLGRYRESIAGFETILRIDPTDFAAWQFLSPLYQVEGRTEDSQRADAQYLQWRDDPKADVVAAKFFAEHPEWADERIGHHFHTVGSQRRAVLTGKNAVPDK